MGTRRWLRRRKEEGGGGRGGKAEKTDKRRTGGDTEDTAVSIGRSKDKVVRLACCNREGVRF